MIIISTLLVATAIAVYCDNAQATGLTEKPIICNQPTGTRVDMQHHFTEHLDQAIVNCIMCTCKYNIVHCGYTSTLCEKNAPTIANRKLSKVEEPRETSKPPTERESVSEPVTEPELETTTTTSTTPAPTTTSTTRARLVTRDQPRKYKLPIESYRSFKPTPRTKPPPDWDYPEEEIIISTTTPAPTTQPSATTTIQPTTTTTPFTTITTTTITETTITTTPEPSTTTTQRPAPKRVQYKPVIKTYPTQAPVRSTSFPRVTKLKPSPSETANKFIDYNTIVEEVRAPNDSSYWSFPMNAESLYKLLMLLAFIIVITTIGIILNVIVCLKLESIKSRKKFQNVPAPPPRLSTINSLRTLPDFHYYA